MATDPTLEELSAYVDGELDAPARAELEGHLKTCSSCRARLDGLRQTVSAIRAMPMETPPRAFTVPPQRRQGWRWAPVGWIGGTAAALLVIALGITQLHGIGGAGTASSSVALNRGAAEAPANTSRTAAGQADQFGSALNSSSYLNHKEVVGSGANRKLILEADAFSYPINGAMKVTIILQGAPSQSIIARDQGLTLMLLRAGAGVELPDPVGVSSWNGTPVFARTYDLTGLAQASVGDYQLVATWLIPDASGQVLQASVPLHLTGN